MKHADSLFNDEGEATASDSPPAVEPARPKSPTFREVALEMLTRGTSGVRTLGSKVSKHTLLRACHHLRAAGKDSEAQELYEHTHEVFPSRRGREKARPGEVRRYSVQYADGVLYIRLPVERLNLTKGGRVLAYMPKEDGPDEIIVRPAPPVDADDDASLENT